MIAQGNENFNPKRCFRARCPWRLQIDRKRLWQHPEKKIAKGNKPGGHEEQQGWTMTMGM